MNYKHLYLVNAVVHTDDEVIPVSETTIFIVARKPSQVSTKAMKALGDKLIFIQSMEVVGTQDTKNGEFVDIPQYIA